MSEEIQGLVRHEVIEYESATEQSDAWVERLAWLNELEMGVDDDTGASENLNEKLSRELDRRRLDETVPLLMAQDETGTTELLAIAELVTDREPETSVDKFAQRLEEIKRLHLSQPF